MLAMPVAAIGWPFDSRPPDTLTGVVPSRHVAPDSKKSTAPPSLAQPEVVVVHELGGGEAVVQLDEVEVLGPDAGLLVRLLGGVAGERVDVREDLARLLPRVGGEHRRRRPSPPAAAARVDSVFSFASLTTTAAAAPSQLAEHIGRVFG